MPFKFPFLDKFKKKAKEDKKEKGEKPIYAFEENLSANSLANKALDHIKRLAEIGSRATGSKASRAAAKNIASRFEAFTEDVEIAEFKLDPTRQYLWTKVSALLLPVSGFMCLVGLPYLALIVNLLNAFIIFSEALESKGIFSRFVKKEDGENVRASVHPKGDEESVVILSAHHDSSFLYKRKDHIRDIYIPLISLCYSTVLSLFLILYEALNKELFAFNLPSLFPLIFIIALGVLSSLSFKLFSVYSNEASPGVGDNLTGVGTLLALSEYFSKRKLERTRVDFLSFDGEEAGCQGSKEYYSTHSYPQGTININIDGLYSTGDLVILESDGNGLVALDKMLSLELANMARSMGYKMKEGKLSLFSGATDASSAAKNFIRATTITSMAPGADTPAHTSEDTLDKIDSKTIEEVIALVIKYIESLDKKSSPKSDDAPSFLNSKNLRLSISD